MSRALIDLRSDTVTQPDAEMRQAMAQAEVGDDVFREDPTVRRLEERAAAVLGCEAALFVPSGTMGNQIALHVLTEPGQEVICDADSHIIHYEMGAMAALSGLVAKTLVSAGGLLDPQAVEEAICLGVPYQSRTGVVAVENTHNVAGGTVYEPSRLQELVSLVRGHGLPLHLDGARIFNAAAAVGVPVDSLAAGFDTVMFCLSKGLGAPVGSLLCGGGALIEEARRVRKMLGGGMRQAGVLAAAGLVALEKGPARLVADHANAALLAGELSQIAGVSLDPVAVKTNIVIFRLTPEIFGGAEPKNGLAQEFLARLRREGVLGVPLVGARVRFVTHRDVTRGEIEEAVARIRRVGG